MTVPIPLPADWLPVALGMAACALAAFPAEAQTFPPEPTLPAVAELPARPDLPDPLVMRDGRPVTDREAWRRQRRPELITLFQRYMYGFMPSAPQQARARVDRENPRFLEGRATLREVTLRFGPEATPPLHLLVIVPNRRSGPVPAFLGLNFCGNHAVVNEPDVPIPEAWMYPDGPGVVNNRATASGRGAMAQVWNVETCIARGYAFATFYNGEIEPDYPGAAASVRQFILRPGRRETAADDWGTIAAWAWGLQRAVDYLVTDRAIDAKRIAVVGHSRNGKAALLAAALDERIALAIPHQAGCGGTAPSRGRVGETVRQINDHFPHWFNATFKQFNDHPERLPFDQHSLIALMAPRPVLLSNAEEDTWANPAGQWEMLRAADRVYRFLGVEGLAAEAMPPSGKLLNSRLGYFIRPGKHSMTAQDWQAFLDFADRHLRRAGTARQPDDGG